MLANIILERRTSNYSEVQHPSHSTHLANILSIITV